MKKVLISILIFSLLAGTLMSFAVIDPNTEESVRVYYNDREVKNVIGLKHGPYMIPKVFIEQVLGGEVTVNENFNEVILKTETSKLSLNLDSEDLNNRNTELNANFFRKPVNQYNGQLYFEVDFIASAFNLSKTIDSNGWKVTLESMGYLKNKSDGRYDYIHIDPDKIDIEDFKVNDVKANEKKIGYPQTSTEGLESVLFFDNGNDIANRWSGETTLEEDYRIIEGLFKRAYTGDFIDKLDIDYPRLVGDDGELKRVSYEGELNNPEVEHKLHYTLNNNAFKFGNIGGNPAIGLKTWYNTEELQNNTDGYLSHDLAELREVLRYYFNSDRDFKYFWTSFAHYFYYDRFEDNLETDGVSTDIDYLRELYDKGRVDMVLPDGTQLHLGVNAKYRGTGDALSYIWFTK